MVLRNRLLKIIVLAIVFTMIFTTAVPAWAQIQAGQPINGQLKWATLVGEGTMAKRSSPPAYYDGDLYVVAGKALYKLDGATGETVATANLEVSVGYATLPPTVADDKVLVGVNGSKMIVVDTETMEVINTIAYKKSEINHQTISPIVYDSGYAYVGSWLGADTKKTDADGNRVVTDIKGGTFVKINVATGEVTELINDENGFYWDGACISNGYVLVGSCADGKDDNAPATGAGTLYCYDLTDGSILTAEVDGSICSTIVEHDGNYYFTSKGGALYKATLESGQLTVDKVTEMDGPSTCTPVFDGEKIYVGYKNGVLAYDLNAGQRSIYSAPADVKYLAKVGSDILCTYNSAPGGIYNVTGGYDTFIPSEDKQNYCISPIILVDDIMYYRNDSGYIMAVQVTDHKFAQSITASDMTKTYGNASFPLNAKAKTAMTYQSSNPAIATVAEDGTVTIKGTGQVTITVTAEENSIFLPATKTIKLTVVPKKVTGLKVTAGTKKLTAKWTRDAKASGYQILLATNSKFTTGKKTVTITSNKTVSKTIKSLKKGKYYYVKVRAYKTISGVKKYGAYSTVKKVKVK